MKIEKLHAVIIIINIAMLIGSLAVIGGAICVAWHFISKWW